MLSLPATSAFARSATVSGAGTRTAAGAPAVASAPAGAVVAASANPAPGGGTTAPGALTIISTAANAVTRTVKLSTDPVAVAVAPDARTAYVAGAGSDESGEQASYLSVNMVTGAVSKPIAVGTAPTAVALSPDGRTAYVVCGYDAATQAPRGSVTPVNTATGAPGKPVKVAAGPTAIAISPNGKAAFVIGANAMTLFMTASGKVSPSINLQASSVAITPDSKTAYVVGHVVPGPIGVFPVTVATGARQKEIFTGASVAATLAIAPNGQTVYVVGTPDPGLGATQDTITTISTATDNATKTINLGAYPGSTAWEIAVSPNGKTAYALGFGSTTKQGVLIPVNTATGTAGKAISVGDNASAVVFAPNSQWAYVLDYGAEGSGHSSSAGRVLPIDVATGAVGKPITVPAYAEALAAS